MEQLLEQLEQIVNESESTNSFSKACLLEMIHKVATIEKGSLMARNGRYVTLYRTIKDLDLSIAFK